MGHVLGTSGQTIIMGLVYQMTRCVQFDKLKKLGFWDIVQYSC